MSVRDTDSPDQKYSEDEAVAESLHTEGARLLQLAEAAEQNGDLARAKTFYTSGLEYLIKAMKSTPPGSKRDTLKVVIDRFMKHAEKVQAAINAGATSVSAPVPERRTRSATKRKLQGALRRSKSETQDAEMKEKTTKDHKQDKSSSTVPKELRTQIESEIMDLGTGVTFKDVIGLGDVKRALQEMVIYPALRPDLFTGIRRPPKGLLLFGPPGNGKTFIAKAVASEAKCTFFAISAASLVSKHVGEGERLVKALFAIAREKQPSIIFIDEIDSILSKRTAEDHEASRRLKNEFFIQFDGVNPESQQAHVVVIGATNIPEQLDDALIRRLQKRIYVPLPDEEGRTSIVTKLLATQKHSLSQRDLRTLVQLTDGYSASDLNALCTEASMGPVREIPDIMSVSSANMPPIALRHFEEALKHMKPSVSREKRKQYESWAPKI